MGAPDDDLLTRRRLLIASGVAGSALLLGCGDDDTTTAGTSSRPAAARPPAGSPAACVLSPEQTEGPYYVAGEALRRDITEGRPGTPLRLSLAVQSVPACRPVNGATVELWHADAGGEYSGFGGASANRTFLRGGQRTGVRGIAVIDTIFPGWYQGRSTHIHVKVHAGGDTVHTGQLYFADDLAAAVFARAPYSSRGTPDVTNEQDPIFSQGGRESLVAVTRRGAQLDGRLTLGVRS